MNRVSLTHGEAWEIRRAVERFVSQRNLFEILAKNLSDHLRENDGLKKYISFVKYRVKDPDHLKRKLRHKALQAKVGGQVPSITADNLFSKIPDLAGVRIIHLHTDQMRDINPLILDVFTEYRYRLVEGPKAICWDVEYEEFFTSLDIETESRNSMYTSVHYVVEPNQETQMRAELQVRTLTDEVWAEVSHKVNYPEQSPSRSCQEQLRVLARLTTGCTRLVDSILESHAEAAED